MERLYKGHLHPLLKQPETNVACVTGEHSYKELFEQLITVYSETIHKPNKDIAADWEPLQTLIMHFIF
jgi:hypothetical protein